MKTRYKDYYSTISVRKKRLAGDTPAFEAVIETAQDYYPFGSLMPGRKYNAGEYRFGFNGKEKDDEIAGVTGADYDYGFRIYDSRISRFLSVDPLTKSYPMLTPYQFASNSPISGVDLDGLEYYYSALGNFIGVGDPKNLDAKIVLDNSNATKVKNMTEKERIEFYNNGNSRDVITLPSDELVNQVESFYSSSTEKGLVVGKGGETSKVLDQGLEKHVKLGPGYDELRSKGINASFDIHSHPNPGIPEKGNLVENYEPSPGDKSSSTLNTEANWVLGWENYNPPEPTIKTGTEDEKPSQSKKITIYDKKNAIKTLDFDKFKKAVNSANKDFIERQK